jgi:hypothetical protein
VQSGIVLLLILRRTKLGPHQIDSLRSRVPPLGCRWMCVLYNLQLPVPCHNSMRQSIDPCVSSTAEQLEVCANVLSVQHLDDVAHVECMQDAEGTAQHAWAEPGGRSRKQPQQGMLHPAID